MWCQFQVIKWAYSFSSSETIFVVYGLVRERRTEREGEGLVQEKDELRKDKLKKNLKRGRRFKRKSTINSETKV